MAGYGFRPSKPRAAFVAVLCSAMVIYGIVQFVRSGQFQWFYVLWAAVGVFIVAATLRQGFGSKRDRDEAPGRDTLRPSRPMAVLSAVVGAGLIVFGVLRIHGPFLILWVLFAVATVGFNLWSAFGRGSRTSVLERRD